LVDPVELGEAHHDNKNQINHLLPDLQECWPYSEKEKKVKSLERFEDQIVKVEYDGHGSVLIESSFQYSLLLLQAKSQFHRGENKRSVLGNLPYYNLIDKKVTLLSRCTDGFAVKLVLVLLISHNDKDGEQ
jgi:hypothetical protein